MKGKVGIVLGSLMMLMGVVSCFCAPMAGIEDGPTASLLVLALGSLLFGAGFWIQRRSRRESRASAKQQGQ